MPAENCGASDGIGLGVCGCLVAGSVWQSKRETHKNGNLIYMRGGEHIVAKGKYERWLEPDGLTLLEGWARDGLTDERIAQKMGINIATLYRWKQEYCEICEALKRGKEVVDYQVENALLNKALGGDTTAQIFWLKNRKPDKWRDKQQEEKQAVDTVKVIIDV